MDVPTEMRVEVVTQMQVQVAVEPGRRGQGHMEVPLLHQQKKNSTSLRTKVPIKELALVKIYCCIPPPFLRLLMARRDYPPPLS